jgi:hypothetical protein
MWFCRGSAAFCGAAFCGYLKKFTFWDIIKKASLFQNSVSFGTASSYCSKADPDEIINQIGF